MFKGGKIMQSTIPKVYFDWNLWSNITRECLEIDTLVQKRNEGRLEIYISPAIIEEMCQSPQEVINSNLETIRNIKKNPLLRHPNKIEVNELLLQIAQSCKEIKLERSNFDCSILGDGNSPADRDWAELLNSESLDINNETIQRLIKNKLINEYYQNQLKNWEKAFDLEEAKLSNEEAQKKINDYLEIKIRAQNSSIEQLKEKIKREKNKDSFFKKSEWDKKENKEKEQIIKKYCKSQVFYEYIIPFGYSEINRLQKAEEFLGALNIQNVVEAENLLDCIIKKVNYKNIPTLWISIFVTLLQETQDIKRSNIFDQEHASYIKELDYFITCDEDLYKILSDNLLTRYLRSIGSKCSIIHLKPKDISVESLLSKIDIG